MIVLFGVDGHVSDYFDGVTFDFYCRMVYLQQPNLLGVTIFYLYGY
jgi:hypothetical protein